MSLAIGDLKQRIRKEIRYYCAQNENLSLEIKRLESALSNNKERCEQLKDDYKDSEEMIRVMRLITR